MRVSSLTMTGVFFRSTLFWTAALLAVPTSAQLFGSSPFGGDWTGWEGLSLLTAWAGLFLPFAAFSGGLVTSGELSVSRLAFSASAISLLSFLLLGYLLPTLQYRVEADLGLDVEERYPTGANTIRGLGEWRGLVQQTPQEEFSLSVERPLQTPPNWITYLIHSSIVQSLYAVLAALLGALVGVFTTGLSPPTRRHANWAAGLFSGILFFVVQTLGGDWVRADPLNSGVLGAWGPMLLPLLELGVLYLLLARARRGSTLSRCFSSND